MQNVNQKQNHQKRQGAQQGSLMIEIKQLKVTICCQSGELKMKELDLSDNKLTKMEESAFRTVLESMARTNGFLEIGDSKRNSKEKKKKLT